MVIFGTDMRKSVLKLTSFTLCKFPVRFIFSNANIHLRQA